MTRQRVNAGYHRMAVNKTFIHLGSRAIFLTSLNHSRFVHIRDAVADGLARLKRRDQIYIRAITRRYQRSDYQGEHVFILTFTQHDRALLEDIRTDLRMLTDSRSTYFDAVVIALLESAEAYEANEDMPLPELIDKKG